MNPRVGVVIVNWNKPMELKRLLDSLLTLNYDNHDIYVVDNASTDDSVLIVKNHSLKTNLILNGENKGGTGGFNSGIRFAMQTKGYEYIWLLDNDVTVTPGALLELTKVMLSDPLIGISGSRILNLADPEFIVESGAFFDWRVGTVRPVHRNIKKCDAQGEAIIQVDYVAVCSALVRVSAIPNVGLMDERYFLFWDDMDWGIAFQDAGFKAVAVPASEVYHAAFTEYRSLVVDSYYGIRNQLLTFSKYRHHKYATHGMFNMLRRASKTSIFTILSCNYGGKLSFLGYWDFLRGQWGKIPWSVPGSKLQLKIKKQIIFASSRVLLIPMKDVNQAANVINCLLEKGVSNIDILVSNDRKMLFEKFTSCGFVIIDYTSQNVMLKSAVSFLKIFFKGYDVSVKSSGDKISPFTYAVRKTVSYDEENKQFIESDEGLWNIWRVIISILFGEIMGCIMFFFAWLKSLQLASKRY